MLHGSQRRWLAYLHEVVDLIERGAASGDPDVDAARARAAAVIANHHNLLLALPGPGARLTPTDRARLRALHRRSPMSTTIRPLVTALTDDQLALQLRARRFVERVLLPLELEAEAPTGACRRTPSPRSSARRSRSRLHGGRMPVELGGQGWTMLEWFLVNEQFGRVTNGLHWHVPSVYNVWLEATPEQFERYVTPALRGEGGDAYAVTEAEAGSDPGGIATTAVATDGGWRINGEKWFVTSGDVARVLIVMANVVDGADRLPTLFLVEPSIPGVEFVDDPRFTHNYPHGHPDDPVHRRRGGRRRGDRRRRQRR